MEFYEKLQELRKQKGLTQEELAQALYVSRTAVSKWESAKGYPSIDSLKAISSFFSVTVDELLSGNELMNIADDDSKKKSRGFRCLISGLLDVSTSMLVFLPLLAQRVNGAVSAVSLIYVKEIPLYLRLVYCIIIAAITVYGIVTLILKDCNNAFWVKSSTKISICFDLLGIAIFVASLQPYAAVLLLVFLTIKLLTLTKQE